MSDQDETFRVNVRFNRVEYSDLDKDLSRYVGANKGARIRMLMRIGLQVANGQVPSLPHSGDHPHLAPVVGIPRNNKKLDASPPPPRKDSTPQAPAVTTASVHDALTAGEAPLAKQPVNESLDALASMGFDPNNFQFGGSSR